MTGPRSLSTWTKLVYGIGAVAFGVKDNGFAFFLLLYYNQVLGLPEAWVGFGIMLALVVDGFVDPLIGWVSDHLHSRWGRRHPFMYAAALPVAASYWLLWNPPDGLAPERLFLYFVAVAVLVRIFIALYEIPSASLVPELTDEYDSRTSILSYRYLFGWWGGLVLSVLAYAVFLQPDAAHPVGQLNADGYHRYGIVASIIMTAAILVSAIGTHPFIPYLKRPPERPHGGPAGMLRELRETFANPSFRALFGAGVFANMALGLNAALSIYFNTYFWELTSTEISRFIVSALFLAALVAGAAAPAVSRRIGKKRAAVIAWIGAVAMGQSPIVLRLLDVLPPNRTDALLAILAIFNLVSVTLLIAASILVSSMIADLVEDSEVSTGRRSEGVFTSANIFVQKVTSGVGIFVSSLLLGWIGFPRGARPGEVDAEIIRRLGLAYVPAVVALYTIALGCLSAYRISRATHEANLRRLAASASS